MKEIPDETHPAWGVVSLHKTSGNARLFRSATRAHAYMTIRIARARKVCHDGKDDPLIMDDEGLVEIALSPVQFAELLVSGDFNSGVPCTIRNLRGEKIPEAPQEFDEIQECADDAAGRGVAEAPPLIRKALDLLVEEQKRDGTPRKAKLVEAAKLLDLALTRSVLDADYWREEISKRASAVRVKATADFAATVDLFLRRAGLEALKERVARYLPTLEATAEIEEERRP